jgi:thiamine biosynthesis protein ThiS
MIGEDDSSTRNAGVNVTVNGEPRILAEQATVSDLLTLLKLDARYLAVELNRRVVPRAEHARQPLRDGDQVEIVTLVGGG